MPKISNSKNGFGVYNLKTTGKVYLNIKKSPPWSVNFFVKDGNSLGGSKCVFNIANVPTQNCVFQEFWKTRSSPCKTTILRTTAFVVAL